MLLDPGPLGAELPTEIVEPVLERIDWWSGNEAEALAATGARDAAIAAARLARHGFGVVVRQGPAGCLIVERGGTVGHVAGFAVDAIDSNGAGDAHVGVFLAALASGLAPVDAARPRERRRRHRGDASRTDDGAHRRRARRLSRERRSDLIT